MYYDNESNSANREDLLRSLRHKAQFIRQKRPITMENSEGYGSPYLM